MKSFILEIFFGENWRSELDLLASKRTVDTKGSIMAKGRGCFGEAHEEDAEEEGGPPLWEDGGDTSKGGDHQQRLSEGRKGGKEGVEAETRSKGKEE